MLKKLSICISLVFMTACGGPAPQFSQRGESCRYRNECAVGLACVNNVCILNDFDVAPTAKECDVIECSADADCCRNNPGSCAQFRCNAQNRCESRCTSTTECPTNWECTNGSCVECANSSECREGRVCTNTRCVPRCASNRECPYFHACREGTCTPVGCQNDRECVAFLDNPRGVCREVTGQATRQCVLPCENDGQCNNDTSTPRDYQFQACTEGRCVYLGCETDEECRIYLRQTVGSDSGAVCR